MRVLVAVSFVDKDWHSRPQGSVAELDEAYATTLIEQGIVKIDDSQAIKSKKTDKSKSIKRKASKTDERKTV